GILVNDGVRRPARSVDKLSFAGGTPYQTVLAPTSPPGEQVMLSSVARALRSVLRGVVETGTARRADDVFVGTDGQPLPGGGKTGPGDHRFDPFGKGGRLISSRAVSRTAAFTFYIGDRYFGILTASVEGPAAANYSFTSALPLAALKLYAPAIQQ